jgi:Xaa-Pro aminopeptidase
MFPYAERRSRLIESLSDTVDGFLVTHLVNVRYLTGFSGSNGAVLIDRAAPPVLAVDGRYTLQAAAEAPDIECIEARAVAAALVSRATERLLRRIGVEASHVTLTLNSALQAAAEGAVELVPMQPVVECLRAVKDDAEVGRLRRACEITDAAFASITTWLRAGVTEREVAWQLEAVIHAEGGDGPAFDSIVAFGSNSAIPHHQPSERALAAGDLVKVDFGALYRGYHADMTRTVVLGHAADWQRDLHAEVASIQAACRESCQVGAVPSDLDTIARQGIEAAGHLAQHGLGHGVGLEIHEDPFLTPGSTAGPLSAGMTVTIEPGIYLADRGGVRIEDTMLVAADGATPLTASPRELLEVG